MGEHWMSGPTRRELEAIAAEWPLIEAELAVVDAESVIAVAGPAVSELDRRRLRRAEAAVTRRMSEFYALGRGPLDGAA